MFSQPPRLFLFSLSRSRGRVGRGRGARASQTSVRKSAHTKSATRARLSAFHHGSYPSGLSALGRSSRPGFHGTWQDVRSGKPAPTGEQRSYVLTRALPAPACPSPGNAPPGPVVVPVSMMPEAARERSVSFRARAPHSLHLQEYPRPKASFTERDSQATVYLK